jgi:gluconokinase
MESVTRPVVVIVMGVSASGKSTVGRRLAERLGVPFLEGDDLHSPENRRKMASGHPLTDEDRGPWLDALADWIRRRGEGGQGGVVTCSALKRAYRDRFRNSGAEVWFLDLRLDRALATRRIAERTGHFMPLSLLASQFDALEPLQEDEPGAVVNAAGSIDAILAAAESALVRDLSG